MPHTITLAEAKVSFDDLVERARRGEESLITDANGLPVARIAAAQVVGAAPEMPPEEAHAKLFGLMPEIQLLPGWDDPLEEFEEYS